MVSLGKEAVRVTLPAVGAPGCGQADDGPGQAGTDDRADGAKLTAAQNRMWVMHQLDPLSGEYNIGTVIRCEGPLDIARLSRAVSAITVRHENLRCRFPAAADGSPTRVVADRVVLRPATDDCTEASDSPAADEYVARIVHEPFDLAAEVLCRVAVLRCADGVALLVLAFHHIICDGWSVGVLLRDLARAYDGDRLPPAAVSGAELARRETSYLASDRAAADLRWWVGRLRGAATPAPLSTHLAGALRAGGEVSHVRLDEAVTRRLEQVAGDLGGSLFSVACAAVSIWIARVGGGEDIAVGTPVALRGVDDVDIVCLAVNTVVIRIPVKAGDSVRDVLSRTRDAVLDALQRRRLPFDRVVEALAPGRSARENPLFDVLVSHQNVPVEAPALNAVDTAVKSAAVAQVRLPLEVTTWRRDDGLELRVGARRDRYDQGTAKRIAAQLATVLEEVARDADIPVALLPVLPAGEDMLLADLEQGGPSLSDGANLPEAVLSWAWRTPDAPAVLDRDGVLTFAELDVSSARIAARLRSLGIGPGDTVGIALPRDRRLVSATLGVLRSGAAFVPLNLRDPDERRAYILADSATRAVLADGPADWAPAGVVTVPVEAAQAPSAAADHLPGVTPDAIAYVIYTSGTTGRPKGVRVEHRNVMSTLADCTAADGFAAGGLGLVTAASTFDVFYYELFAPMLGGGASYLVSHDELYDADRIGELLHRATAFQAVPGMMEHLLQLLATSGCGPSPSVRRVMTGGDSVPVALLRSVSAAFPAAGISITYGPTESAIFATRHVVDDPEQASGRPVGRPIAGARVRVADDVGRRLPLGAEGEIWIGGAGVARGYHSRPAETASAFVTTEGTRWYRSGDRGRWRPDGVLEFLGRDDGQVKVRGVRVELGEVEAVASAVPGVARAAAVASGSPADSRLDLFVVPQGAGPGGDADAAQVARWHELFDRVYASRVRNVIGTSDFTGWQSSYTGDPYPPDVMGDWQRSTVRKISQLLEHRAQAGQRAQPPRILEIGCGTGLLTLELAPAAARYYATDISAQAIADLRRRTRELGLDHVEVSVGSTEEIALREDVDAVIVNSVSQYLPSAQYLERMLDRAFSVLAPGGFVFVGDIRNLATLRRFHREIAEARGIDPAECDSWAGARASSEEELLLDPAWFERYAAGHDGMSASASRRFDQFDTEMRRHRYDVVLGPAPSRELGPPPESASGGLLCNDPIRPGRDRALVAAVRQQLTSQLPQYMLPSTVTVLDRVPLTGNGKLDRGALPAPRQPVTADHRQDTAGERDVRAAWAAVLGHADMDVTASFFDVGGTSLLAVKLAAALRTTGRNVTPQQVFELRTIQAMAAAREAPASAPVPRGELPPRGAHPGAAPARLTAAKRVLLTGSTGMLGIHLLEYLLRHTEAEISCLVRGQSPDWALSRLADQFSWYFPGQSDPGLPDRVRVICGDLTRPRFGIADGGWDELTDSVEHVIHAAADVRHAGQREEIFGVNVTGTQEVLRLVRQHGRAALHHVSTVGVSGRTRPDVTQVPVLDEGTLYVGQVPTESYSESKIAAEDLVRRHLAEGFTGSILRVGTIAPDSRTGRMQRDVDGHFFNRFLRSTLELGILADWPHRAFRLVPADAMAAAVCRLADSDACPGGVTYHIEGARRLSHPELAGMLADLGYPVRVVAPEAFVQAVTERLAEPDGPSAVTGVLPLLSQRSGRPVPLESSASVRRLAEVGADLPETSLPWLRTVIEDGVSRGYFPPTTVSEVRHD